MEKLVARKLQSFLLKLLLGAGLLLTPDLVSFGFVLFRNGCFLGARRAVLCRKDVSSWIKGFSSYNAQERSRYNCESAKEI